MKKIISTGFSLIALICLFTFANPILACSYENGSGCTNGGGKFGVSHCCQSNGDCASDNCDACICAASKCMPCGNCTSTSDAGDCCFNGAENVNCGTLGQ